MKRVRMIAAAVLAVLLIVLLLQNLAPATATLLVVPVRMPLALLLLVTLLGGFALGLLAANRMSRKPAGKGK